MHPSPDTGSRESSLELLRRFAERPQTIVAMMAFQSLWFVFTSVRFPLNIFDEGYALVGADRVLRGEVPFRDFWTVYSPGHFYALAAIFKVFGASVMTARAFDVIIRVGLSFSVYVLFRRVSSPIVALGAWAGIGALLGSIGFYSYSKFPALLLTFGALLAFGGWVRSRRSWLLAAAGFAAGVAVVLRHDLGAVLVLSLLAGVLIARRSGESRNDKGAIGSLGTVIAGVAIPVLAAYGLLLLHAPLGELWNDLVVFPLTDLGTARRLPAPAPWPPPVGPAEELHAWALFYVVIGGFLVSIPFLFGDARHNQSAAQPDVLLAASPLLLLVPGLFFLALYRPEAIHILPALLPLIASLALISRAARARVVRVSALGLIAAFVVIEVVYAARSAYPLVRRHQSCPPEIPRVDCVEIVGDQRAAIQYVRERTGPNEPLFVGNSRHDRIFVNDVSFYFLAERPIATRFHDLVPGVATTREVQATIVRELQQYAVPVIVLRQFEPVREPNASSRSSGVHLLDRFIRSAYRQERTFGVYSVWVARDSAQ